MSLRQTTADDRDDEREEIRGILADNVRALNERIQAQWEDDPEPDAERLQLTRLRTLGLLARQYRLLARDADIDEMAEDVDFLEDVWAVRHGDQ